MRIFASELLLNDCEQLEHTDFSIPLSMATLTGVTNVKFYDFCYYSSEFYLFGANEKVLTTSDFSTFTTRNLYSGDRIYRADITESGLFYGIGTAINGNQEVLFYSDYLRIVPTVKKVIDNNNRYICEDVLAYGGGLIVGKNKFTDYGVIVHGSNTGNNRSFVLKPFSPPSVKRLVRIEEVNNRIVAIGDKGYVVEITRAVSTDENINYSITQINEDFDCYNIAYGNGKYVVVSRDGYCSTSTDLENWSEPKRIHENISEPSIVFAYNKFIIVDYSGRTISSYDGENWQNFKTIVGASQNIFANAKYVNGDVVVIGTHYSQKTWKPKGE